MDKKTFAKSLMIAFFGETAKEAQDEPPKKIVSKTKFVKLHALRAKESASAGLLLTIGVFCTVFAIVSVFGFLLVQVLGQASLLPPLKGIKAFFLIYSLLTVGAGVGACLFLKRGFAIAHQIEPVTAVPLTRANAATLPARDSLVRASEEPSQEPQAILLRAAAWAQATPSEQLVRLASGREGEAG